MDFYCAGNWKLNKNPEQASAFVKELRTLVPDAKQQARLMLLPTSLIAWKVAAELQGSKIHWGGQNCFAELSGAFTGETSAQILKEMGASSCLVGHSERRKVFHESDDLLAKKVSAVQGQGLIPLFCVGETLEERQSERTADVILTQLRNGLKFADSNKPLWLAYEPVWAIGTGHVAKPEQVEEAHQILRKALSEWHVAVAEKTPILYGGSVKPDNARTLAQLKNVNGFLIGGASLAAAEFARIFALANEARA